MLILASGPPFSLLELRTARFSPVNKTLPNGEKPEVPLDEGVVSRNYLAYSFTRWPNGRIPYTLGT